MAYGRRVRNLEILRAAGLAVPPSSGAIKYLPGPDLPRAVVRTERGPFDVSGTAPLDEAMAPVWDDPRLRPGGTCLLLGGADLEALRRVARRLAPRGRIVLLEPWPELWRPLLDRCDLGEILGDVRLETVGDADFARGTLALAERLRRETEALGGWASVIAPGYLTLLMAGGKGARPLDAPEAFREWARAIAPFDIVNTPSEILGGRRSSRAHAAHCAWEGLAVALPGLAHLASTAEPAPPPGPERLSVVLVTYRRPDLLGRAIGSLASTWPVPGLGEVVVVDNAGDAETARLVEAAAPKAPFDLRRVVPPENLGCSGGRNFGAAAARGAFLLILDDDVEFTREGWWRPIASAFATHPRIGCVSAFGVVHRRDDESEEFIQRAWLPGFPLPVHWGAGFGFCVRREAWEEIGGHHPCYGRVGGEDVDVGYGLRSKGWAIVAPQEPLEPLYLVHRVAHATRAPSFEAADRARGVAILKARWGRSRRLHDAFASNAPMPLVPRPVPADLLAPVRLAA